MCHFLISYPLNAYVSFPEMMQGDKGNIKVNLGITSVSRLIRFYHVICILSLYRHGVIQHYSVLESNGKNVVVLSLPFISLKDFYNFLQGFLVHKFALPCSAFVVIVLGLSLL